MNLQDINKLYAEGFDCCTEVVFDENTLFINIENRDSVQVDNINKSSACAVAEFLLEKWDFSYFLEFNGEEEVYNYFK
jgi:hypothetical protein